ncbi:matrixin family metalloprotease [Arthrobacter sp. 92]|uniref:matrixin family metalloprotease n=1 Tax=Arthrobacter sp. 92 TaxID=3418175 RepID=UPI003D00B690
MRFLSVVVLATAMAATACTAPTSPVSPTAPVPPVTARQCLAPDNAVQQDVSSRDSPEKPWPHSPGTEVTVNFETSALSNRYADLVRKATGIWSQSPCIQAVPVATCPPNTNCIAIQEKVSSNDRGTDGEFRGSGRGTYRDGGTITLYTGLLDRATDNGALATIVHEMGHALGLVHRRARTSVMNSSTNDNTNPVPDDVDFANLLAIYGKQD